LEEVPVAEIYRRSSKFVQYQTFSNPGFKQHFYRMKIYKVTYHLKKKVGEKYGGPTQESSLCATRLASESLTSDEWILLGRDNYNRRGRMTYLTDISSTPEFRAYEGTKEKLGGFDKMWNMLKKEAEKKPQYLSITVIDTEYMTIYSLKRAATEKYLDDQLLNTFFSYMNRESRYNRNESLLSIHCFTTHFLTKLFQEDDKFDYTKFARWC
jgi:hypothetical protein